jgi:hypothetical protein
MIKKTMDYKDYDQIIEGLVDFWMNSRPRPNDQYKIFCGLLEQRLRSALDELQEWVEINL